MKLRRQRKGYPHFLLCSDWRLYPEMPSKIRVYCIGFIFYHFKDLIIFSSNRKQTVPEAAKTSRDGSLADLN